MVKKKYTLVKTETTVVTTTVEANSPEEANNLAQWPEALDSETDIEVYDGSVPEDDLGMVDPVFEVHT